jgi:putative ABC transport system substrate-binding protein
MATDSRGLALSRRQFVQSVGVAGLGLLGGCGRAPPLGIPRIGYLSGAGISAVPSRSHDAFVAGLSELGYIEGQNILIEWRSAQAEEARARALAAELLALPVDLLVVTGMLAARSAQRATATVPIVIAFTSSNPVADGFVASLARPGGNITGLSVVSPQLSGKRLELLKALLPALSRVAVLWSTSGSASAEGRVTELQDAARVLGLQIQSLRVRETRDLAPAFGAAREKADAVLVLFGAFTEQHQGQILKLAETTGLPALYDHTDWVRDGGLMAYGPGLAALYRALATYVGKILNGAKPADLPVEQPMTFDFVINLQTAQALGLTIPQHVLLQATEVIQ